MQIDADLERKLAHLLQTKHYLHSALIRKGWAPFDYNGPFRELADKIRATTSGDLVVQEEKTIMPTAERQEVLPDEGYNAAGKVIVQGDAVLQPWNIPKGITIFGVEGTLELGVTPDSNDWPDDPGFPSEEEFDDEAEKDDPDIDKEDYMLLVDNEGNITKGYLYTEENSGLMVYNGHVLPDIETVRSEGTGPYAFIVKQSDGYTVRFLSTRPYKDLILPQITWENATQKTYALYDNGTEWMLLDELENYSGAVDMDRVVWTNIDIRNGKNGTTVAVAASTPTDYGGFEITWYDHATTEFKAIGWRRVSKHTTGELAGQITVDDFTTQESGGWNYLKNIRKCTRDRLFYNGAEVWPVDKTAFTLLPGNSWHKSKTARRDMTEVNIVNVYEPTGEEDESWIADVAGSGGIMCYIDGTTLTVVSNQSEKIAANVNSRQAFSLFNNALSINGTGLIDTSAAEDISYFFTGCNKITDIDVSGFNTSNAVDMERMFSACFALKTLDVSNFDTRKTLDFGWMFSDCEAITTLDLRNFDTRQATDMRGVFVSCEELRTIYVGSGWSTAQAQTTYMFSHCGTSSVTRV